MSRDVTIACAILTVTKNKESLVVVSVAGRTVDTLGLYNKDYVRLATTGNGSTLAF